MTDPAHTPDFNPWDENQSSNANTSNSYAPPPGPPPNYAGKAPAGSNSPYDQHNPSASHNPYDQRNPSTSSHNPFEQTSSTANNPYNQYPPSSTSPPQPSGNNPYAQPPPSEHRENPYHQSSNPYDQPTQHQQQPAGYPNTNNPYTSPYSDAAAANAPSLPPRRADTFNLPADVNRGEQIETLQSYEAVAPPASEDDKNVEILQREFPGIDGSLIAAIYGDSKSLGATREMLHALKDSS